MRWTVWIGSCQRGKDCWLVLTLKMAFLSYFEAYGTLRNETKRNGTLRNGTLRNGTLRNGTLRDGTLRNGTLRNGLRGVTKTKTQKRRPKT